jgi:hypothetical protein
LIAGLLEERPVDQLADFARVHKKTAARYVKALRVENLVAIVDWEEDYKGRRNVPVYQFKPYADDIPRPPRMSERVRNQRYRETKRRVASVFALADKLGAKHAVQDGGDVAENGSDVERAS